MRINGDLCFGVPPEKAKKYKIGKQQTGRKAQKGTKQTQKGTK
jgi:hypothetical protein